MQSTHTALATGGWIKRILDAKPVISKLASTTMILHRLSTEIAEGGGMRGLLGPRKCRVNSWRGTRRPSWICGVTAGGATCSRIGMVCDTLMVAVGLSVLSRTLRRLAN